MRLCVICGAKVTNINPLTCTCGPTCTRARKNGLTLAQQIRRDVQDDEQEELLRDRIRQQFIIKED